MLDQIKSIISPLSEAVFIIDKKKLAYYNNAAQRLIPRIEKLSAEDIFPKDVINHKADNYMGELDIFGIRATYSVTKLDKYKVLSILSTGKPGDAIDAAAFSALSREMKNYLTLLKAASDIVLPFVEETGDKRLTAYSSNMNKCYYNIHRLVSNAETLGSENNFNIIRKHFDLVEMCKNLMEICIDVVSDMDIKLSFKCDLESLVINADEDKLVQLIMNMISNSLLNTPVGGNVVLTVTKSGDNAMIRLSDTGKGIPSHYNKTVWTRFSEARDNSHASDGAGFGIAVMSKIARLHGGNIILESRENKGTIVAVSIPINPTAGTVVKSEIERYRTDSSYAVLVGLSTVAKSDKYLQKFMD